MGTLIDHRLGDGALKRVLLSVSWAASVLLLAGCSASSEEDRIAVPESAKAAQGDYPGPILFNGAGLAGLRKVSPRQILAADELARLFALAYDGQTPRRFVVSRDGENFLAEPVLAFRTNDGIAMFVDHVAEEDCHACSGFTSVVYFDPSGEQVRRRFPFAISGSGWGSEAANFVSPLDGSGYLVYSVGGGGGQGYFCESVRLFSLDESGVRQVADFPSSFSDAGAGGSTDVTLVGIGVIDGGQSLRLRFEGSASDTTGDARPVSEERILTLDGQSDGWLSDWPYIC